MTKNILVGKVKFVPNLDVTYSRCATLCFNFDVKKHENLHLVCVSKMDQS